MPFDHAAIAGGLPLIDDDKPEQHDAHVQSWIRVRKAATAWWRAELALIQRIAEVASRDRMRQRKAVAPIEDASAQDETRVAKLMAQRAGLIANIGPGLYAFAPPPRVDIVTAADPWIAALRWIGMRSLPHAKALVAHGCIGISFRAMGASLGTSTARQQKLWRQACAALVAVQQGRPPEDLVEPSEPNDFRWVDRIENHRSDEGRYPRRPVLLGVDAVANAGHDIADLESIPEPNLHASGDENAEALRATVFRVRDNIATLVAAGTIDLVQAKAAHRFRRDFKAAGFEQMRAVDPISGGGGGTPGGETEARIEARQRVGKLLDVCGGRQALPALLLWHVAGAGRTLDEASRVQSFGLRGNGPRRVQGRTTDPRRLAGAIAAALDVAAAFYRNLDEERQRERDRGL